MTTNGVIETSSGDLIRAGYTDFSTDPVFDSNTETYRTDVPVPSYVRNKLRNSQYHNWDGSEWVLINNTTSVWTKEYLIELDTSVDKDFRSINYKTELNTGVSYTPVYTFQTSGEKSGLIECTDYYKDYIDDNNMGTLILKVCEDYVIETAPSLYNSVKSVLSRTKTWQYVKVSGGQLDLVDFKVKSKLYNTRKKRHNEAIRRRDNILEQLIDNVGLAGVLSGTFADADDAHQKLIEIQLSYAAGMDAWISSGHGTIYDDLANDTGITWLDDTVVDTANTQAMVPWMIGMSFKDYIVSKIKGEIE